MLGKGHFFPLVEELKRLVVRGEITSVSDSVDVGFGSVKTARSCFDRIENQSLDEFIQNNLKRRGGMSCTASFD